MAVQAPYVKMRPRTEADGSETFRPRFEPGPREVALGFRGQDLKHEDGRWFTPGEAVDWARENRKKIREARKTGTAKPPAPPPSHTIDDLLKAYLGSDEFKERAPKTRVSYRNNAEAVRWQPQSAKDRRAKKPPAPELLASAPARIVGPAEMKGFYNKLKRERGVSMARAVMMVLSAAYTWGRLAPAWKLGANPCHRLRMTKPAPRIRTWSWEAIVACMAAARASDEVAIAHAIWIGLITSANPVDVLALEGGGISDGQCRFIRSKTKVRISVPAYLMADVMAEAKALREARGWTAKQILIDPRTGNRWNEHTFRHRFAAVRQLAEEGDEVRGIEPCPDVAGIRFQDLRDTHFTWSHRAGNDLPRIASVTGHKPSTVAQMAEHYLDLNEETAAEAMEKFGAFLAKKQNSQ